MICECYRAEKNFLGKVGVCWGTAERDACSCGGDKSKCDFYPSVREEEKKPVTNYDRIVSKSPEELAGYLAPCACPPIHFDKTGVIDCPVGKEPCESDCKHCWIDYLKREVEE